MPEAAASILRLMAGLKGYRRREIAMEIAGTQGVMRGAGRPRGRSGPALARGPDQHGRRRQPGDAAQRISERVLGLPREATPDRGVPFSEVLAMRRQRG